MPILRLLFVVLLLLNLLALAASTGLLGVSTPRGEPERLTNQLNPERIRLHGESAGVAANAPPDVAAAAAPAADAAGAERDEPAEEQAAIEAQPAVEPLHCVTFEGLGGDTADAVVRGFDAPEFTVRRTGAEAISGWWVRIPPDGTREFAERKGRELRALGISDFYIVQDPGPNQYAISLGLFKTEAAANQHLDRLRNTGVRSASIGTRSTTVYRVEIRGAREAVDSRLADGRLPTTLRPAECTPP